MRRRFALGAAFFMLKHYVDRLTYSALFISQKIFEKGIDSGWKLCYNQIRHRIILKIECV